MTVGSALETAAERLKRAGIDTARLDARLLLGEVLGARKEALVAHPERALSADDSAAFAALLARREAREPLPYLLGWWEFLGMRFRVTPAVLIPRPETETLVETVAAELEGHIAPRILDVGTGSGCVAIGLASLLPGARVDSLDPSPAALEIARENALSLGVAERVEFHRGAFPESVGPGPYAAIVSNPPYIPTDELDCLQAEIRDYEPRLALDGGADGLDVLRPLATQAGRLLEPGGLLAVEVAMGQADRMAQLVADAGGWSKLRVVPDLSGVYRVLVVRRQHG